MTGQLPLFEPTQSKTREALANDIWRACDILRRDDNCSGVMEYMEHLSWLLFLRFLDAQEEVWERKAAQAGRSYERILEGNLGWSIWTREKRNGDELLSFIHDQLIPYLASLSGSPMRDTIATIFADRNITVCASPYNLRDVMDIVDGIDFHSQDDIHTISHIYEGLLERMGNENRMAGEFHTPRPVVRFIVYLVKPQIGETVYDPACGVCGFLVESYELMKKREQPVDDHETLQQRTFYGQEKKRLPALLGLMNMVLHGITAPNVVRRNTLEESILRTASDQYDVVLTNPPFGGTEGRHIQVNFPVRSNATELLFLQHIMKKLKARDGARCGMVVPEGTLFRGGAFIEVKKQLLEQFDLHTVVSLPPGTFAPYSDVKAALLFFERPGPTREIWYCKLPLPEDLKKFSKGSPIQYEHFAEAQDLWMVWHAYRRGEGPRPEPTDNSWIVPVEEIKERSYDLSARNPNRDAIEALPHPAELTTTLMERVRELSETVQQLHEMLNNGDEE